MGRLAAKVVRYQSPLERPAPGTLRSDDVAHAVLGAVHRIVQRRLIDGRYASLPRLAPAICALLAAERSSTSTL
jgi:hypothetical protein